MEDRLLTENDLDLCPSNNTPAASNPHFHLMEARTMDRLRPFFAMVMIVKRRRERLEFDEANPSCDVCPGFIKRHVHILAQHSRSCTDMKNTRIDMTILHFHNMFCCSFHS